MAVYPLHDEFIDMLGRIALADRALIAIAAHFEVRSVLATSDELRAHGLDDILIGSYARRVSIWPGKDVDLFGRLSLESVNSMAPDEAYEMFGRGLQSFADQGRVTPQPRSFKVGFDRTRYPSATSLRSAAREYDWRQARVDEVIRSLQELAFEFSVDVVPAVGWDKHYGIPQVDRRGANGEQYRTGAWRLTDPVALTTETHVRNRAPKVAGRGAFVPTVKAIRQIKAHHLPEAKPSSLYYEFALHEGFKSGEIVGNSWADIISSALSFLARRVATASSQPVCDPILAEPYAPAPSTAELGVVRAAFGELAGWADRAVTSNSRCQAAIEWRRVFGGNDKYSNVFWLPAGCRGTGAAMGAAAANVSSGGTAEKSFGEH
ncbi:MAG: hypothetical protein M3Q30_08145 [Actinomycetota bacterium]|nr:hypothetical protein [Actinomycetota bacterium]